MAPSLIPTRPGDRVKTNRRDATMLARLHRAGELTPVWVPDADHEAMRDLIRLRSVVRQIVSRARQHLQGFLLRHGRKHGRGTAWRMAYRRWLSTLAFEHPAQQIAFQDYVDAVMDAERRLRASRSRYRVYFPNGICAQLLMPWEVDREPAGDLLRAPGVCPPPILPPSMSTAFPGHGWAGHKSPARSDDAASQSFLHIGSQCRVDRKLPLLWPASGSLGMPLRCRRAILQTAASSGGIAPQLP